MVTVTINVSAARCGQNSGLGFLNCLGSSVEWRNTWRNVIGVEKRVQGLWKRLGGDSLGLQGRGEFLSPKRTAPGALSCSPSPG